LVACTGQSLAFGKSPCWPFGDTGKNKVISGVIQKVSFVLPLYLDIEEQSNSMFPQK